MQTRSARDANYFIIVMPHNLHSRHTSERSSRKEMSLSLSLLSLVPSAVDRPHTAIIIIRCSVYLPCWGCFASSDEAIRGRRFALCAGAVELPDHHASLLSTRRSCSSFHSLTSRHRPCFQGSLASEPTLLTMWPERERDGESELCARPRLGSAWRSPARLYFVRLSSRTRDTHRFSIYRV